MIIGGGSSPNDIIVPITYEEWSEDIENLIGGSIMVKRYYNKHYDEIKDTKSGRHTDLMIKRCEKYTKEYVGKFMEFKDIWHNFRGAVVYVTDFKRGGIHNLLIGGTIIGFSPFYPDDEMDKELEDKYHDILRVPVIW